MIDCTKTENYFAEKQRMTKRAKDGICKIYCQKCPLSGKNNGISENVSCRTLEAFYPEKAIAIIQKWSDEHPQKTYLSELLKIFPNIPLSDDGTPTSFCPFNLGVTMTEKCNNECVKCWNQPIEGGEK